MRLAFDPKGSALLQRQKVLTLDLIFASQDSNTISPAPPISFFFVTFVSKAEFDVKIKCFTPISCIPKTFSFSFCHQIPT